MTHGGSLFAAYYAQHASRLPAGYREVEWIAPTDTSTQYIETGWQPDWTKEVYVQVVAARTANVRQCLSGNFTNAYTVGFSMEGNAAGKLRIYAGGTNGWNGTDITNAGSWTADGSKHRFWCSFAPGAATVSYGVASPAGSSSATSSLNYPVDSTYGVRLFRDNRTDTNPFKGFYLYEMTAKSDGIAVRSYVPCVRIADGKPGMYDLCGSICPLTNTPFYVNAGTGADFLWGELS